MLSEMRTANSLEGLSGGFPCLVNAVALLGLVEQAWPHLRVTPVHPFFFGLVQKTECLSWK